MVQQLGFIGLGTIGFPICRNLAESGVKVVAYDARPRSERVEALTSLGARVVSSLADVADGSDTIMTVLPDSDIVDSVMRDPALLERLRSGMIWIDTSSGYPTTTIRLGERLAALGVTLIDAPICNGSVPGAYERRITLCVGGDPTILERVRPMLALVASNIIHVGPLGSGHAVKTVNNSITAAVNAIVAEGLALGEAYGLDGEQLIATLRQCSGGQASFDRAAGFYQQPVKEDIIFQLFLGTKDLRHSTMLAGELGSPHSVTDAAHALFEVAERVLGPGAEMTSAPAHFLKRLGSRRREARERQTVAPTA